MKGHVGGGSGFNGFKALIIGQIKSFLYVLLHIHSNMYLCRNGSLKWQPSTWTIPPRRWLNIKLESLILAQNERWRHA